MKTNQSLATITPDATLSQIVSVDQKAGQLLASIGLEPTKYEHSTLRSVCQQRQWSESEVLKWIKKNRLPRDQNSRAKQEKDIKNFSKDLSKWHPYMEANFLNPNLDLLKDINRGFPRVHQIHGNQYTWLKDMQWSFDSFKEALSMYYEFQLKKFYPLLKGLSQTNDIVLDGTVRKLERCISIIEEDQQRLQSFMQTISEKGHHFVSPPHACSTFQILNQNFKTLFNNLEQQFELEQKHIIPLTKQKIKQL